MDCPHFRRYDGVGTAKPRGIVVADAYGTDGRNAGLHHRANPRVLSGGSVSYGACTVFLFGKSHADGIVGQERFDLLRPFDEAPCSTVEIILRSDVERLTDFIDTVKIEMIN